MFLFLRGRSRGSSLRQSSDGQAFYDAEGIHAVSGGFISHSSSSPMGQVAQKEVSMQLSSSVGSSANSDNLVPGWWSVACNLSSGVPLKASEPIVVSTNASLAGCRAHCLGQQVQGQWNLCGAKYSNFLGLDAVRCALSVPTYVARPSCQDSFGQQNYGGLCVSSRGHKKSPSPSGGMSIFLCTEKNLGSLTAS